MTTIVQHRPVPVVDATRAPRPVVGITGAPEDDLVSAARRAAATLPADVVHRLDALHAATHDVGALLLRGVDLGAIPATPPSPTAPTGKDSTSELQLLAIASVLGEPVGYLPEHGGDVVQNILPTAEDVERQTSTSSRSTLGFHTETAFHPHRPRFLVLACLRGDTAAATTLCCIDDLLDALSPAERAVLSQHRFRTRADESFGGGPSGTPGELMAVLSGDPAHPTLRVDAELTSGEDAEAAAALAALVGLIERHHTSVVLGHGDVLVVDNHRCVHGRSPFAARFDGSDRWLQRAFVVDDLAPSAGERVGRIITTTFA